VPGLAIPGCSRRPLERNVNIPVRGGFAGDLTGVSSSISGGSSELVLRWRFRGRSSTRARGRTAFRGAGLLNWRSGTTCPQASFGRLESIPVRPEIRRRGANSGTQQVAHPGEGVRTLGRVRSLQIAENVAACDLHLLENRHVLDGVDGQVTRGRSQVDPTRGRQRSAGRS